MPSAERELLTVNSISTETALMIKGKTKTFSDEVKQKGFAANRSTLKGSSSNKRRMTRNLGAQKLINNRVEIRACIIAYNFPH